MKNKKQVPEEKWNEINQLLAYLSAEKEHLSTTLRDMESEMSQIEDKYHEQLKWMETKIVWHEGELKKALLNLNKKYGVKSKSLEFGSILIRAGSYSLKTLESKITFKMAAGLMKAFYGDKFVVTKLFLNKGKIIQAVKGKVKLLNAKDLAQCGLRIEQDLSVTYKTNFEGK